MTPDEVGGELVGFARRRAVADGDELHLVLHAEGAERAQRAFPVLARLVRIDRRGLEQAPGAVHHRHLDAGANAGVEPHRDALSGGSRQQQVVQVNAEHANGLSLGLLAQPLLDLHFEVHRQLELPGPAHGFLQPGIGRTPLRLDAELPGNATLGFGRPGRPSGFRQHHRQAQKLFLAAAEQGKRTVRRDVLQQFAGTEVIGELAAGLFLAVDHLRHPLAAFPQQRTQPAEQFGVFREALHQDPARAFECRGQVGDPLLGIDERRGFHFRRLRRVAVQRERQRLEPGFTRDLRLGATLLLVGEIQVFEARLGVGVANLRRQLRRQLALLLDALQDGCPALF